MSAAVGTGRITEIDSLAMLSLKVAPNVFDISSEQYHISIRDQIVRGQLLIRDLRRADGRFGNLLVVGAGVGGAAAAVAASYEGVNTLLVDMKGEPFWLQRQTTCRRVAPFMYEWPGRFDDQQYPPANTELWGNHNPAAPCWAHKSPMTGVELATALDAWLDTASSMKRNLAFLTSVDPQKVRDYVQDFVITTKSNFWLKLAGHLPAVLPGYAHSGTSWRRRKIYLSDPFVPDYVILAGGMGGEVCTLSGGVGTTAFWEDDKLRDQATANQHVGVFGGGDGALQDVLRALTEFDQPLDMLANLQLNPHVRLHLQQQEGKLLTLESQARLFATWTQGNGEDSTLQVDKSCQSIAKELATCPVVRNAVFDCIRKSGKPKRGKVLHFVRGSHFDKAYLLNRFLVHLIHESKKQAAIPPDRMDYELRFGQQVVSAVYTANPACTVSILDVATSASLQQHLDLAVVRFGLEKPNQLSGAGGSGSRFQMVQLSKNDLGQRTTLNKVPLPFVIPDK